MKKINCYKTCDDIIHEGLSAAKHHAEERYGSLLTSVAHKLVRIEKYTDMVEFLEHNLEMFTAIKALKDYRLVELVDEDD